MKRAFTLIIVITLLFSLTSCERYTSSFKAMGLVRSVSGGECEASFHSLEGRLVFKLKKSGGEGDISFSARLDEGELYIYYDIYGTKQELAHVVGGDSVSSRSGYIEGGKTVYIIIEATEKARGELSVKLN